MLHDLLVIAAIAGCGWLGSQFGLAFAGAAALELFACVVFGTVAHEFVIDQIDNVTQAITGISLPQAWLYLLVYAGLVWGSFALVRRLVHRRDEQGDEPLNPLLDRVGGAVAGGVAGFVLAGAGLITLSMLPLLQGLKPAPQRMMLDAGGLLLRTAGAFAGGFHEGRSLVLEGEPPSRPSIQSAHLTNEPWSDADGDGAPGEADRFSDVDGSGSYSKDLYYTDLDGDGMRRVGLLDKYRTGVWDYPVLQYDRERSDLKKPEPPPAPPKPAAEAPKPEEAKPVPEGPAAEPAAAEKVPEAPADAPATPAEPTP
ncbi:MAG: hypothetical protein ACKOC8_00790 [Pirellulales bacterium]